MNIAVTGLGIVCAIGNDVQSVLRSLRERRTGIGPMRHLRSVHKELPVGEVKLSDEEMKRQLGQDERAVISRTALMGAIAIRQALQDAGLDLEGKRVVIINGTTVGGMDVTERVFERNGTPGMTEALNGHSCGSVTHEMADLAGLHEAEVCTVSTACSSALNAIILGAEMLRRGEADIVIAGGTEALSKFHLNGFNSLMILDKKPCRPFDKTRAGLNLGEGAAFVVMKLTPQPPLGGSWSAYILGYGNRCDAFHQTASSADGEGAFLAMSDALRTAGLRPGDIDYINAHGTGTPNNDTSESAAIRRVFGDRIPPVSSTKGFTGHATSASGAIETVVSILALRHGFVPTNLGWRDGDEACITPYCRPNITDSRSENHNPSHKDGPLATALCNSFGFGGNDSALIVSTKPAPFAPIPEEKGFESCVLAEETIDDVEQLGALRQYISAGEARRMSRLMKAACVSSMKALRAAGIECPDAIITATAWGMFETSEKLLRDMLQNGEEALSPTLFMQCTHNTIGSAIAIRLRCHGYNMTYSQGADSLLWAMRDARRLIETGRARTVLVGCHDEATPLLQDFLRRMGRPVPPEIYSHSIVLGRQQCIQTPQAPSPLPLWGSAPVSLNEEAVAMRHSPKGGAGRGLFLLTL